MTFSLLPSHRRSLLAISLAVTLAGAGAWSSSIGAQEPSSSVPPGATDSGLQAESEDSNPLANAQCRVLPAWLLDLPEYNGTPTDDPDEIRARADFAQLDGRGFAYLTGNVNLFQGGQILRTDRAEVDQQTGQVNASGGLTYSDGYIAVRANEINADQLNHAITILESEYVLIPTGAIGRAGQIDILAATGEREVTLHRGTFTTCPGERPAWMIQANKITVNENESWGTAHHAQFRIFDVPVVYIPRFSFPLTDERKSGLLYPTIRSSSRNGVELEVPYYFNLAPNYDLTLTPRLLTERGIMAMTEGRYLTENHQGTAYVEYLHNDRSLAADNSRSLMRVEQRSTLSDRWTGYVDFAQVSDVSYINDFGAPFANRADSNLYRRAQFDYRAEQTRARIQFEDFQMLGPFQTPYRTLPRIAIHHVQPLATNLEFSVESEFTHFRRPDNSFDHATRTHIEPGLQYRMVRPAWDWTADVRYLMTYYEQSDRPEVDSSVSRFLPQYRWHGQIHLERQFQNSDGFQTLTPQIQYLYVPFRDQSRIGIYDTILMQDDYHSLFRPRRFTGLDRIADAHQVTIGGSTSFFDSQAEERMRLSLGQIIYLDESRTQLFDETSRITGNNSELAAELDFRLSSRWFASSALQYDTDLSLVRKSRAALEYRQSDGNLIQLNHRRVRGLLAAEQEVEQAGLIASWEMAQNWRFASHWYQDLNSNRTMDAMFGVQYDRCCWSIRVSAYRRVNRNYEFAIPGEPLPEAEFDNGVSLQFILSGLGGSGPQMLDMLQQSIFGYRRPFYLNN
ncbi:LPS-assembly protein LptD [Aliidiomarina sanyensis]|uniref:LPS-assembly protein LptD n=1 Tax=Aliidiomarina sanyensis TaxID=1249555 RepID=A0A432WCG4_9GAMM|nr:LPS assembly protein LptD [Aliidiomarina sanyensis]RUO30168.1 LPS-assembly protein LptD [Aliidiomarina sanyensis]